jgi:hypothetical protein
MFRESWSRWLKSLVRPEGHQHAHGRQPRLEVEGLETRLLLSFLPPVSYNIGAVPSTFNGSVGADAVAVGDFNGDGKQDLAVVHTAENSIDILLNKGNGTFLPPVSYPTRGVEPLDIIVRDFNGDGKLDIAVTNPGDQANNFKSSISIFMGNGNGTFKPAVTYASGRLNRGLTVGDFWGDGKLDLATTNFLDNTVNILRGNGDGTFRAPITVAIPQAPRSLVAGDFDGNGGRAEDLAVVHGTNPNDGMTILLGNGNGTFQAPREYAVPPTPGDGNPFPEFVIAGDLRNSGKTDLVVSLYDHNIDVFLGNGNGTFQPAVGYDTGEYPRAVALADVNGDGKKDLVVTNIGALIQNEAGSVAVLLGNGNGTFQPAIQYTPVKFPGWVAVGDFNGDGWPDLALTRVQDGHSVDVMLNQAVHNFAPSAPTNLTATAVSAAQVTLTWKNTADNQSGFHIDRATNINFTQNLVTQTADASAVSFIDIGLIPGKTYFYRVRATNAAGDSPNSNVVTVTTLLSHLVLPNSLGGSTGQVMAVTLTRGTTRPPVLWTNEAGPPTFIGKTPIPGQPSTHRASSHPVSLKTGLPWEEETA